jgi:hypothetical protein
MHEKFTGRRHFLETLQQDLTAGTSWVVGQPISVYVGKTALAVELGWRLFEARQFDFVLFLNASTLEMLNAELASHCASDALDLPEQTAKEQETRRAGAMRYLSTVENGRLTLLIHSQGLSQGSGKFQWKEAKANALSAGARRFFHICPRRLCTRANPKSREGRLRSDRVCSTVGDAVTAENDRRVSAGDVILTAKDDSPDAGGAAGGVVKPAADDGIRAAGGVILTAGDAGLAAAGYVDRTAADAGKFAAGGVLHSAADAGEDAAGNVAHTAADSDRLITDRIRLTCNKAAKSSLCKIMVAPDHQVV